jgi:hypothetical protein
MKKTLEAIMKAIKVLVEDEYKEIKYLSGKSSSLH